MDGHAHALHGHYGIDRSKTMACTQNHVVHTRTDWSHHTTCIASHRTASVTTCRPARRPEKQYPSGDHSCTHIIKARQETHCTTAIDAHHQPRQREQEKKQRKAPAHPQHMGRSASAFSAGGGASCRPPSAQSMDSIALPVQTAVSRDSIIGSECISVGCHHIYRHSTDRQ